MFQRNLLGTLIYNMRCFPKAIGFDKYRKSSLAFRKGNATSRKIAPEKFVPFNSATLHHPWRSWLQANRVERRGRTFAQIN